MRERTFNYSISKGFQDGRAVGEEAFVEYRVHCMDDEHEVEFYVKCFPNQTVEEIARGLRKYHPDKGWNIQKVQQHLKDLLEMEAIKAVPPDDSNPAYVFVDPYASVDLMRMWKRFQATRGRRESQ